FEKVYYPYLLIGKKHYAGLCWTGPTKPGDRETKGIAIARRDRCVLVQNIMSKCLDEILINRDVKKAIETVHHALKDLLQNNTDIELLTFTKGWSKETYITLQPHVQLAKRMMERDQNIILGPGDRITYVIIAGPRKASISDKSEHPDWVKEKNLPIDKDYYI